MANHNPNLAKIHRNYEISEVAELYQVHRSTVRQWVKDGLPSMTLTRPHLIFGADLREFLRKRRDKNRVKLQDEQLYCLRCKSAQYPEDRLGFYTPKDKEKGVLQGLCPKCGGVMNKFISLSGLKAVMAVLDVSVEG